MNGYATDDRAKDPNSDPMDHDGAPDDDSDPVVHEIPVFIAKSLQNNLYLFQVCLTALIQQYMLYIINLLSSVSTKNTNFF